VKISEGGLSILKRFEGLRLSAYRDAVGVWTIGYGHTSAAGAPTVIAGLTITAQRAEDILVNDLRSYEAAVIANVKVPLNQNQYDALVSFTYNVGPGALKSSTLLKKLNAGDYAGAAAEFAKWNKGGGKVLAGLVSRRAAEAELCKRPVTPPLPVEAPHPLPAPAPAPPPESAPTPLPESPKGRPGLEVLAGVVLTGVILAVVFKDKVVAVAKDTWAKLKAFIHDQLRPR
jgi:GH24 family phage-related lysozyme (muramidase)